MVKLSAISLEYVTCLLFITKVFALATFLCLLLICLIVFHVLLIYLYVLKIGYCNVVFQLVVKYLVICCHIFTNTFIQITYFCAL